MKRAMVTGGTRGIGAAIVAELERNGIKCVTFSRSFGYDATKPEDRARVKKMCGSCDILINNVGGGGRFGTDAEVWEKNVGAMIDFTEWAMPHMVKSGWGRVITISSIHGKEYGSRPIFMAAKSAQIAWMKGVSKVRDYVRNGVTFNTVCPGNVQVDGKPIINAQEFPMGRLGTPAEVAKLVAFLCSNNASWINGAAITIDGGESNAL